MFTLRAVREMREYSAKDIASHCGINEIQYMKYEKDFGETPARIAHAIYSLLKISPDNIYIRK